MSTHYPTAKPRHLPEHGVGSICIVGGGTAGWMAAATLRRRLQCDVTLIESPRIPGVGVGEATIPALLDWIENMRLDEDDFIRQCGATYKLAIRFDNWVTPKHRYWHPFGICGVTIDDVDLVHFWKRGIDEGWLSADTQYADFSIQKTLCELNRSPRHFDDMPIVGNYAFHLDAAKLAQYLKNLAITEGVYHQVGEVIGCDLSRDGSITRVIVANQPAIEADLYIDCSGFAATLIEKSLQVPWIDWSHQLLCDRAITLHLPASRDETNPFTISTGLDAGWAWQIPLNDRIGAGYVYSSNHMSSDAARSELISHLGIEDSDVATRELTMRIGRREKSWTKNCVSIGLSSGFVEPLESTGIFLVQRAIDDLVECLPNKPKDLPMIDEFNHRMVTAYEEVRDFVLLHYVVSKRDDTSFWRDARAVDLPESLVESMQLYESKGMVHLPSVSPVFAEVNHHFIMTGAGRAPALLEQEMPQCAAPHSLVKHMKAASLALLMIDIRKEQLRFANELPSHHANIKHMHQRPLVLANI